ncbi:MAG: hypothetical protein IPP99_05980 [Chitinophagaceae bacterium]|nr:hypothetical protein [Chitinophagaceae bacterium]
MQLDPTVEIDRYRLERLAAVPYEAATGERLDSRSVVELSGLCEELLPEFDEAWVIAERERCRQLALAHPGGRGPPGDRRGAPQRRRDACVTAIRWDPLRESATRALVEAHLAQGNLADAERAYAQYASSLAAELGAEPHPDFLFAMRRGGRGGAAERSIADAASRARHRRTSQRPVWHTPGWSRASRHRNVTDTSAAGPVNDGARRAVCGDRSLHGARRRPAGVRGGRWRGVSCWWNGRVDAADIVT